MLLHEKLSALQQALGVKNADLARPSGLDAASVSRFLLGKRLFPYKYLPLLCDTMARMFPQGAEGESLPPELRALTGDGCISSQALSEAVLAWLRDSPEYEKKQAKAEKKSAKSGKKDTAAAQKIFGEKLSLLMDLLGISGIQLAAALHVDPSMVYKYRVGARSPKEDMVENITLYICSRAKDADMRRRVLEAAGTVSGTETIKAEDFKTWLDEWLSEEPNWDTTAIESLLEALDDFNYSGINSVIIPLEELVPLAGDITQSESFWGIEGMRAAATRYLYHATTLETPTTLYICTTSTLDFLTMDSRWKAVWSSLMAHCLLKGHTIKMIHNMYDRDVTEVIEAFEAFGPLYMIGRMEPYIFKKQQGNTIRYTIYLIENQAVVTASYAEGLDDEGEYVYSTEPRRVAAQKKHFDALLSECVSLAAIYRSGNGMEGYDIRLGHFWGLQGDATLLLPSLSLATIPETILYTMLERIGHDTENRQKILAYYAAEKKWFDLQLSGGKINELSVAADRKSLEEGEVFYDIPSHLVSQPIPYTQDEYLNHLKHIRKFKKQNANYKFQELSGSPFRNIKVYYKPSEVIVQKAGYPSVAFVIGNIYMCRAAERFLSQLCHN